MGQGKIAGWRKALLAIWFCQAGYGFDPRRLHSDLDIYDIFDPGYGDDL